MSQKINTKDLNKQRITFKMRWHNVIWWKFRAYYAFWTLEDLGFDFVEGRQDVRGPPTAKVCS